MASLCNDKKTGRRRILFVDPDGVRKTVRLGTTTKRDAESFKGWLERLLAAAELAESLPFQLDLWKVQNTVYGLLADKRLRDSESLPFTAGEATHAPPRLVGHPDAVDQSVNPSPQFSAARMAWIEAGNRRDNTPDRLGRGEDRILRQVPDA